MKNCCMKQVINECNAIEKINYIILHLFCEKNEYQINFCIISLFPSYNASKYLKLKILVFVKKIVNAAPMGINCGIHVLHID
jgi:hypothetical protein